MSAPPLKQEMLRAARNQSLYREVNERIEHLNKAFDEIVSLNGTWVCECADPCCTETMELTLAEYESLRAHPNRLAVVGGHEYDKVERVVEEHDQWVVVEKLGAGAEFAIAHDPRANRGTRLEASARDARAA
jgi:hypothetical protein